MNKLIGVYKITNKKNNNIYIGISVDIKRRWKEHKNNYNKQLSKEYNKILYKAMRKYGLNNFLFSIIEICDCEELRQREIFWIKELNTYNNGYNETTGGDISGADINGEKHPNHKLSKNDVISIRISYNNHERKCDVYIQYKDKINKTGFHKVWNGYTWKNIMPEVFTNENILFHKNNTGNVGMKNGRALLTLDDVKNIRKRRAAGEKMLEVYNDYALLITKKYMYNVWNNYTWKDIV